MGNWPIFVYIRFFIVLPVMVVILFPHWILKKLSGQAADKYEELTDGIFDKLDKFVFGE